MRHNSRGQIARDYRGAAVACWLDDDTQLFQQPVTPGTEGDPRAPWQMATTPAGSVGRGTPLPGVDGGANFWAAARRRWMRRNDDLIPLLSGSEAFEPPNGRVGDISPEGAALALSDDSLTMHFDSHIVTRAAVQGFTRYLHGLACFTAFGKVMVYDAIAGVWLSVRQVPFAASWALAFRERGGRAWVVYGTDELAGVCHRIDDATQGYRYGTTQKTYAPNVHLVADGALMGWSSDEGQFHNLELSIAVLGEDMVPLPTEIVVPPPVPFGPLGDPLLPGALVDIASHVVGDPSTWPRTGTHPMHQVIDGDRIHFVKFGDPQAYETWSLDAEWVHHLEDASHPETQVFTDTRWLPRGMRVGEAHAFSTGEHEAIWMRRAGCEEIRRGPFHRRMWVVAAWDRFSCGPDLGERPVVCVAYDATAGFHAPDRGVELYYFAAGGGWIRWEYHHSDRVFAAGAAVFSDHTRKDRSDFYRRGGAAVLPALTTCAIAPSTVHPETPMQLHPDVVALFRTYLAAFPPPRGEAESEAHFEAMRAWILRFSQQVRFSFPEGMPGVGGEFGTKSAGDGRPASKESLALREGRTTALHSWDLFNGAATGQPEPNFDPGYHDIWHPPHGPQVFIAVDPVDHLGAIVAPTNRPTIKTPMWGLSSFDLAIRLAERNVRFPTGDRRWIDEALLPYRLAARLIVASVYRRPAAEDAWSSSEKLAISRARFRAALAVLSAAGLQCEPTLLCDTKYFGLTRSEALAEVRLLNAIMIEYPHVIAGVRGGNELSGGNEQPYMIERAFWAEADAIIDPRWPFAAGAGHGGEGVSMLGGSYFVHHANRDLDATTNAAIMAEAQRIGKRPVWDAEQIGVAELGTTGQRVYHAEYLLQSVRECLARGLGGVTAHLHAGLWADVDKLGPVQRDALARFGALTGGGAVVVPPVVPPTPIPGGSVTPDQIAAVVAGGFFERVADHVGATGSVEQKRPKVYAWMLARIAAIAQIYLDVFTRACDLEGYGSCMTAYLEQGVTDDELRAAKQKDYDAGAR